MRKLLILVGLLTVTAPLQAQPSAVVVQMTNFHFAPAQIALKANVPFVLQLRNESSSGHNFAAPAFFAAAHLSGPSASLVREGRVEVPAHQIVQLELVPEAGQYPLRCSHTLHSTFGMRGTITVR